MKPVKYTIAGGTKEGLVALDSIINVTPGDTDRVCYIKVMGSTGIKAANTVAEIEQRMMAAAAVPGAPSDATHISFKQLLLNRQADLTLLKNSASKARLEEVAYLLTLVG